MTLEWRGKPTFESSHLDRLLWPDLPFSHSHAAAQAYPTNQMGTPFGCTVINTRFHGYIWTFVASLWSIFQMKEPPTVSVGAMSSLSNDRAAWRPWLLGILQIFTPFRPAFHSTMQIPSSKTLEGRKSFDINLITNEAGGKKTHKSVPFPVPSCFF